MKKKTFKTIDDYVSVIGADIIENSNNPYEVIRFIANSDTCVIYEGKKGLKGNNDLANKIIDGFYNNELIKLDKEKREPLKRKFYNKIIERDGNLCFYTNKELSLENASIEHLIPLSKGGKNNLDNLVLCLKEENLKMGDTSLVEKIKYKISNLVD